MAKQLLHSLGYPLVVDLKITNSNIKLMEHLYGPDMPTIKDKTTR